MLRQENYRRIAIERRGAVTVLTLNRPERRNAVDDVMHSELSTLFREARRSTDAEVYVLTGAGETFCAGGDTDPGRPYASLTGLTPIQEAAEIVYGILELDQPLIAAVNGDATGLGAMLASAADVSFAVPSARFGDAHVQVGLPAGNGPAALWPLLAGPQRAKRLLLGGEMISTDQAVAWGLLHELVTEGSALDAALALAGRWAELPRAAVRGTKATINAAVRAAVAQVLPLSLALEEQAMAAPDFRRRLAAAHETQRAATG
ncbi:enoyl-CoA hydratase/isomerase family protein [Nonomuraea harbinensis]|uniref:Enoyl-CoA hydratase/isomerase family protein n=1 Tax=Nonomuraea harbinensis TaxID=1286938 RepID=A0ABW1BYV8_9ACTN|nr:enoyl-CoA hydratase/isomerase family protein [Nonomuraea harbinensis]